MNRPVKRALISPLVCLLLALTLNGCAYHLGPTNGTTAGAKTVQIHPFTNQTLEPRISNDLTAALRKELMQDGTYRVATGGNGGDIVVSGVITEYRRNGMTYKPQDVITVRDFRIIMTVHVTAREQVTGNLLFDQTVTGSTLVRAGNDLPSDERQALPVLADDVAKKVTSLIVDGSW